MNLHSSIIRLLSVALALVVLVATIGIALNFHICKGEVKSIGFFEEATACSSMDTRSTCSLNTDSQEESISAERCCSNHQLLCKLDIEKTDQAVFKFNTQNSLSYGLVAPNTFVDLGQPSNSFLAIHLFVPPLIEKDFSVLFQTFLI